MRIFVVGTDTGVGKTAVTASLLRTARARGVKVVPFKPAQSGGDRPSDAERLLSAAGLSIDALDEMCPLRFERPVAPGMADDPAAFLGEASEPSRAAIGSSAAAPGMADEPAAFLGEASEPSRAVIGGRAAVIGSSAAMIGSSAAVIGSSVSALDAWEARHQPALTLVEGAGGLHVPMPGGTWQPAWIVALAPWTLVVGRAGLGTINHCLATIAGLRAIGRPPLGFVLSQTHAEADPSVGDNAAVIARASGVPHLGTLPYGPEPALAPALLDALLARLPR
jgi:dethiobiotin synthetase